MKKINIQLITLFLIFGTTLYAQDGKYSCSDDKVAFDGNDLTEYYNKKVIKGSAEHQYVYDGLTLYFSNATNMATFKKDPEKYLPAYNGWCATAVANGSLYKPNYNHFKIQDDKLLFFEVRAFFNGKTAWEKNPELNMILADKKYDAIKE